MRKRMGLGFNASVCLSRIWSIKSPSKGDLPPDRDGVQGNYIVMNIICKCRNQREVEMSTTFGEITNPPTVLNLTQFYGGEKRGRCLLLALHDRFTGSCYIELTISDVEKLRDLIQRFLDKEV